MCCIVSAACSGLGTLAKASSLSELSRCTVLWLLLDTVHGLSAQQRPGLEALTPAFLQHSAARCRRRRHASLHNLHPALQGTAA